MSTVGIVVIALAAGAFLILFLLGLALLLWKAFESQRLMRELRAVLAAVQAETAALLEKSQTELKTLTETHANRLRAELESAKAALTRLHADVRSAWVEESRSLSTILAEHRQQIGAAIDKINAEALQAAAARSIAAVQKLEKVVGILQKMMLEAGERPGVEYGPEEFAPEADGRFGTPVSAYSVGATARLDEEAAAEERVAEEAGAGQS